MQDCFGFLKHLVKIKSCHFTFSSPCLFVVFFNIKLFKISGSTYFSGYISSKLPIEELIHEKICNILAR